MFPLTGVLFPYAPLPLQVFEPRYRALVDDMLHGVVGPEFGVVLIERGHEVGGGEARFTLGTIARVVDVSTLPDGRSLLVAVGSDRIRVQRWLDDDPYPRAQVGRMFDANVDAVPTDLRRSTETQLRRVLALASELGAPISTEVELSAADDTASFEIAAAAPIGPLDALSVLELRSSTERFRRLLELLVDQGELLEARRVGP